MHAWENNNPMTEQEINEAVARKLGWTKEKIILRNDLGNIWGHKFMDPMDPEENECDCNQGWAHGLADYCHSITAAWQIVEKVIPEKLVALTMASPRKWIFTIEGRTETTIADSAPMAICLAYLKIP